MTAKRGELALLYALSQNADVFEENQQGQIVGLAIAETCHMHLQACAVLAGQQRLVAGLPVSGSRAPLADQCRGLMAKNPAAKKFFEVFGLSLIDISEQNTRMNAGEKSQKDIEKHVDEWIAKNKSTWDGWLDEARKAAM